MEAVIGEPVSASYFPVCRENTGKFAYFGLEMTEAPRLSGGNSIVCERKSLAAKTGKIWGRTGNRGCNNKERGLGVGAVCSTPLAGGTRRHGCSRPDASGLSQPYGTHAAVPQRANVHESRWGIRIKVDIGFRPSNVIARCPLRVDTVEKDREGPLVWPNVARHPADTEAS